MAKYGKVEFGDLKKMLDNVKDFNNELDEIYEDIAKELTARLLRRIIKRTPRDTGTLARGWGVIDDVLIDRQGDKIIVTLNNPVKYGSYVNYGHRTVSGGWVKGQFFVELSVNEVQSQSSAIVSKLIKKKLGGLFDK